MDRVRVLVAAASVLLFAGCGHVARPADGEAQGTGFDAEWKRYVALPPFKAMVVAGDKNGAYVVGTSSGQGNWEDALAEAYKLCDQRRRERSIVLPCRPYAVNQAPTGRGGP